jgi:hypothetical protein
LIMLETEAKLKNETYFPTFVDATAKIHNPFVFSSPHPPQPPLTTTTDQGVTASTPTTTPTISSSQELPHHFPHHFQQVKFSTVPKEALSHADLSDHTQSSVDFLFNSGKNREAPQGIHQQLEAGLKDYPFADLENRHFADLDERMTNYFFEKFRLDQQPEPPAMYLRYKSRTKALRADTKALLPKDMPPLRLVLDEEVLRVLGTGVLSHDTADEGAGGGCVLWLWLCGYSFIYLCMSP